MNRSVKKIIPASETIDWGDEASRTKENRLFSWETVIGLDDGAMLFVGVTIKRPIGPLQNGGYRVGDRVGTVILYPSGVLAIECGDWTNWAWDFAELVRLDD